ncbi:MAG: EAL domain-containing protein [Bacteroidia bacterium]|nr:EAL domain-containing protein [Bacteroidia bacterium]
MNKLTKKVSHILPAMRISFALVLLTISLLLIGDLIGFTPNERQAELRARKIISESLAIQFSILAVNAESQFYHFLEVIVNRDNTILTAGIRNNDGDLVFHVGNHTEQWGDYKSQKSTANNILVPIFKEGKIWRTVELKFAPLRPDSFPDNIDSSIYKLVLFILIFGFFAYLLFILRTLRQLDPSAVVPERVNAAFDTLAEGVLILDEKEQIVLANKAFAEKLGRTPSSLLGIKASELNWKDKPKDTVKEILPWTSALQSGKTNMGYKLDLPVSSGAVKKFVVNCAPISGDHNITQGVLITFNDVTVLEQKNIELSSLVSQLEITQVEVTQQNKELHFLSTRDPLTGCLNRRAFYEAFGIEFAKAKKEGSELSCLMADIDHFKLVNDNYGHSRGDDIIQLLADILHSNSRKNDLVGRYGGEEFCVVLPGLSADDAISVAERIRLGIMNDSIRIYEEAGPNVTASLGVASIFDHAANPAELNDQADKALYVAKESGRNRVIRWNPRQEKLPESEVKTSESTAGLQPLVTAHSTTPSDDKEQTTSSTAEINRLQIQIKELESLASKFSQELQYSQNYDSLTNLPNQALFYDRIAQAIIRGHRYDYLAGVVTIDVSLFNEINSSIGRASGDILLKELADRLIGVLRKTDGLTLLSHTFNEVTISRFGADEFGVLLTDLKSKDSATWIIERILDIFSLPFEVNSQKIYITCNLGVSLFPVDADGPEELIRQSLAAKQHAKQMPGKNNFQYYDAQMQTFSKQQMQLEIEIRRAIKNEEWMLFYQPKVDIASGKIKGVEALIRWNHPEQGILSPYHFIEFAEKRGFIEEIGSWVLKTACAQAKEWLSLGIEDVKVAINLAPDQLRHKYLAKQILAMLDEFELPPRHIELEVTETSLMYDLNAALDILNRLHCRGIAITIDDFGTGYSSLSYLKNLPVDTLKIDRSFIIDIVTDDYDKNIVKTVISMAHGMDLLVVAEGVETQEQYDLLQTMSCDVIQGYLFSKPLPASEVTKLLLES